MKMLWSNSQLYEYLLRLADDLRKHGADELADTVVTASRAAASLSTEFLGESRNALRRVSRSAQGVLTEEARADLSDVLKQLDAALDAR